MPRKAGNLIVGLPPGSTQVQELGGIINVIGDFPVTIEDFTGIIPLPQSNPSGNFLNEGTPAPIRPQGRPSPGWGLQATFLRDQLRGQDLRPQPRPFTGAKLESAWLIGLPFGGPGEMPLVGSDATTDITNSF